jgi:hypothetical protein
MKPNAKRIQWLASLLSLALLLVVCTSGPRAAQPSERQAKAMGMWQERCRAAGEKIHRTVDNVEGVYLLKLRPSERNFGDQFKLDDPYTARDVSVEVLLLNRDQSGSLSINAKFSKGYSYVEAQDPKDGQRYRYTGRIEQPWLTNKNYSEDYKRFVLDKTPATGPATRYGVTYDDISTREEREYWIAGSSLKVVDLQTNEVIAERIGYMIDRAQGSQAGGRSPWLLAAYNACPAFPKDPGGHPFTGYQVRDFVEKVLKPFSK